MQILIARYISFDKGILLSLRPEIYAKSRIFSGIKKFFLSYYELNASLDRLKIEEGDEIWNRNKKQENTFLTITRCF